MISCNAARCRCSPRYCCTLVLSCANFPRYSSPRSAKMICWRSFEGGLFFSPSLSLDPALGLGDTPLFLEILFPSKFHFHLKLSKHLIIARCSPNDVPPLPLFRSNILVINLEWIVGRIFFSKLLLRPKCAVKKNPENSAYSVFNFYLMLFAFCGNTFRISFFNFSQAYYGWNFFYIAINTLTVRKLLILFRIQVEIFRLDFFSILYSELFFFCLFHIIWVCIWFKSILYVCAISFLRINSYLQMINGYNSGLKIRVDLFARMY